MTKREPNIHIDIPREDVSKFLMFIGTTPDVAALKQNALISADNTFVLGNQESLVAALLAHFNFGVVGGEWVMAPKVHSPADAVERELVLI